MRALINRVLRFLALGISLNKSIVSGWLALLVTCLGKDELTPLLFFGKNFSGRNNWLQLGLLGSYFLLSFFVFLLVFILLEKIFPSKAANLSKWINTVRSKPETFPYYAVFLFLLMGFFVWLLVKNAWVGDDGFISIRVIENFLKGYGLVWNVGERVQVFTHPLWMLLITPFFALIKDPYLAIYWVSLIISLGTVFLVLFEFSKGIRAKMIAAVMDPKNWTQTKGRDNISKKESKWEIHTGITHQNSRYVLYWN